MRLTKMDPNLPYSSKFENYTKANKSFTLHSKLVIAVLTLIAQMQQANASRKPHANLAQTSRNPHRPHKFNTKSNVFDKESNKFNTKSNIFRTKSNIFSTKSKHFNTKSNIPATQHLQSLCEHTTRSPEGLDLPRDLSDRSVWLQMVLDPIGERYPLGDSESK